MADVTDRARHTQPYAGCWCCFCCLGCSMMVAVCCSCVFLPAVPCRSAQSHARPPHARPVKCAPRSHLKQYLIRVGAAKSTGGRERVISGYLDHFTTGKRKRTCIVHKLLCGFDRGNLGYPAVLLSLCTQLPDTLPCVMLKCQLWQPGAAGPCLCVAVLD
jgi:hypothetical protein